jgi:hypothetical protein
VKPFRFGVNVWRAGSRAEWADKARRAEDRGYSTLTERAVGSCKSDSEEGRVSGIELGKCHVYGTDVVRAVMGAISAGIDS